MLNTQISKKDQKWLEAVIGKINAKMDWVAEKSRNKIPYTTINGTHDDRSSNPGGDITDGIN